jgi:large subunit ribosomal protein L4
VIESFDFEAPKTKIFNSVLNNIIPSSSKVLVVDDVFTQNTALSARNVDGLSMTEAGNLNALDLVRSRNILISAKGIETLITRANGGES